MFKKMALLFVGLASSVHCYANNPFFLDKQRGWLWREEPVVEAPVEEELPKQQPLIMAPQSKEPETVVLDVAWLKANMERLMVTAINQPTKENLAAFAYAQRLMLDTSSRFSSKMAEFMELEETLDESNRRPLAQFAINTFKGEQSVSIRQVFDSVNQRSGIWFFFSSDCQFCLAQIPVLKQLKAQYGTEILAISRDGGVLPGMEDFEVVFDNNLTMSDKFGVQSTPSFFLVDTKNAGVIPVAEGLQSLPDLESKIMLLAKENGFVSEDEYMLTRGVREVNVYRNQDGQILADKEKLESDPGYIADLLRQKLKDLKPYGAVRTEQNSQNENAQTK